MNPSPLDFLTFALATYYLAITATKLHGPFGLSEKWRHWVYRRQGFEPYTASGEVEWLRPKAKNPSPDSADPPVEKVGDDWVTEGVSCPLCGSLYAGALVLALSALGGAADTVVLLLAMAGGASVLYTIGRTWD